MEEVGSTGGNSNANRGRQNSDAGGTSHRGGGGISRVLDHRDVISSETRVSREQNERNNQSPIPKSDESYFDYYSQIHVHEVMVKDRARTETYRTAIFQQQKHIKDKVVVDVGCGTGILSMFCAQAGAKRVYAVEASEIALQAKEVVKANNLSETVTVLHAPVEDIEINEEVDVIISEWMGHMLLYEGMLGSVLTARDRWLKPGGLMLPSYATLYIAPFTHPDRYRENVDYWRDVYGFDMSAMLQLAIEVPSVETLKGENVLATPQVVKHIDCYTIRIDELESITTTFEFQAERGAQFHGFAFWFDVEFSGPLSIPAASNVPSLQSSSNHPVGISQKMKRENPHEALVLSNAPEKPDTHWEQTLVYFYDPMVVGDDQQIEGSVTVSQGEEDHRHLKIHLEYTSGGRSFVA